MLDALESWLQTKLGLISQKTKLAEAIRYALMRWEGLTRFLDDGRIEIDSGRRSLASHGKRQHGLPQRRTQIHAHDSWRDRRDDS